MGKPQNYIPPYKAIYSLYKYDKQKYRGIFIRLRELAYKYNEGIFYRVNPYKVLDLCYLKEDGKRTRIEIKEEKHIYRYKALNKILTEIALTLTGRYRLLTSPEVLKYLYRRTGIVFHLEEMQAEMYLREDAIGYRLKYHIELLRQLRKRKSIEKAIQVTDAIIGGTPQKSKGPLVKRC